MISMVGKSLIESWSPWGFLTETPSNPALSTKIPPQKQILVLTTVPDRPGFVELMPKPHSE
jgi:hypothetical protein